MRLIACCLVPMMLASISLVAQRRIAVIVDTSGSMVANDPPRYAVQVSKILSDLVSDQDQFAVIRMPTYAFKRTLPFVGTLPIPGRNDQEDCTLPADLNLMRRLNPAFRTGFKSNIDGFLTDDTGTFFAAALHTAISFLGTNPATPRLLLVVTDAQVSDGVRCKDSVQSEIQQYKSTGAVTAMIDVGNGRGLDRPDSFSFSRAAQNSRQLIDAVADVYQRFLGSQKLLSGNWNSSAMVTVDPYVKEAYFIVAADGRMGTLQGNQANPQAQIDYNYRGGGETIGQAETDQRQTRGYRIAHMTNPGPGAYIFRSGAVGESGGWILIQEYAIGLRAVTAGAVAPGTPVRVRLELYDERNGQTITDTSSQPELRVTVTLDGKTETLSNPVGGVFTVERTFSSAGAKSFSAHLRGRYLAREIRGETQVVNGGWRLTSLTQSEASVGGAVVLKVKADAFGGLSGKPDALTATPPEGGSIELNDNGQNGDEKPGDGVYSGRWTPSTEGTARIGAKGSLPTVEPLTIEISVKAPAPVSSAPINQPPPPTTTAAPPPPTTTASAPHSTTPRKAAPDTQPVPEPVAPPPPPPPPAPPDFRWGPPRQVQFGKLKSRETGMRSIDLSGTTISSRTEVEVRSDWAKKNATLELQTPSGWQPLSRIPVRLTLQPGEALHYAVRLRLAECPEACTPDQRHDIILTANMPNGTPAELRVPMQTEVIPEAWWWCWRREILSSLGLILGGSVAYGFIRPLRFQRRVGLQMATMEDLSEGSFRELRTRRGARIGWYRNARVYLTEGFTFAGSRRGAFVSFHARRGGVVVRPENGRALWRQGFDGEWETVVGEQPGRAGVLYRNDTQTLFFEIRTK